MKEYGWRHYTVLITPAELVVSPPVSFTELDGRCRGICEALGPYRVGVSADPARLRKITF